MASGTWVWRMAFSLSEPKLNMYIELRFKKDSEDEKYLRDKCGMENLSFTMQFKEVSLSKLKENDKEVTYSICVKDGS